MTAALCAMKNGVSCYYKNFNRSKKGITLDLRKGRDIFLEMVKTADVVIENFRPVPWKSWVWITKSSRR
jgi:formyl-CoA transferase